jgi:hypothetical protein
MSAPEPSPAPAAELPRALRDLAAFVGLDEADLALVRRTAPAVLEREGEITAALYEHFLQFPASARFFLGPDGQPDRARIERRRHSLSRWLRETAQAALTPDFAYYLLSMGIAHSHRTHGPGGVIPPELMIGAMSLTQSALSRLFEATLADPREALAASRAWNKLLLVQLSVLLTSYRLPAPRSG